MPNMPLPLPPPARDATEPVANATSRPIYLTQPALPPLQEFIPYLEKIGALFNAPFAPAVAPITTPAT